MTQPDTDSSGVAEQRGVVGDAPHATRRDERSPRAATPGGKEPRAIRSPVTWALLGLVIERPSYGYELCKRFERRYAQSLPISSESHIYRSLDTLETKALIEQMPGSGGPTARQPRPCYCSTENGMTGYCAWLRATARRQTLPSELFACALAALAHRPRIALLVIDDYEKAHLLGVARAGSESSVELRDPGRTGLAERLLSEGRRLGMEVTPLWIAYARRQFETPAAATPRRAA